MNKILNLFNAAYVSDLFNKEVLPLYPAFKKIEKIEIKPIKNNVWEKTYHVVIKFATTFLTADGRSVELPLYCTAHSSEPRASSFKALSFLWREGFDHGDLTIPRPLFFSEYFNGYFYRGVKGHNLYYYIGQRDFKEIKSILPKAAAWFVRLHSLPTKQAENFNKLNSRVATVIPGFKRIFACLKKDYPDHQAIYEETFNHIKTKEEKFLNQTKIHWLIHGDAHPENVIKLSERTTAVIDFTDVCLADFARDLGAFLQQFEYMSLRKSVEPAEIKNFQNLFLTSYLELSGRTLTDELKERIDYYYAWTSLRTATLFLMKEFPEPERAHALLKQARSDLKLD